MKESPKTPLITCDLRVEGMDCPSCEKTVRSAVEAFDGYHSFKADHFQQKLTISAPRGFNFEAVIKKIEKLGYPTARLDAAEKENHEKKSFLRKNLQISLAALLIISALTIRLNGLPELLYIPLFLTAIALSGLPIFRKGIQAIFQLSLDMNSLMTIAVIGAVLIGEWFEGATVILLAAIANQLEAWSMDRSRQAIKKLMELAPENGIVVNDSGHETRDTSDIKVDEIILIKAGAKVPLDCQILEGESWFDQSPVTGESAPVAKKPGDSLFAGSINSNGIIKARVTSLAKDSTIARIIHMVQEAQARKAPTAKFVDRFASVYTPVAVAIALFLALVPPLFLGQWLEWLYRALVLLVIACPCALVISTPVGIVSGLSAAAKAGVLIKGGSYLEKAANIDHLVFDKTGTLTHGILEVEAIETWDEKFSADDILRIIASLEQASEHHIASAIISKAEKDNVITSPASSLKVFPGKGISGSFAGVEYLAGNRHLFTSLDIPESEFAKSDDKAFTKVFLGTRENLLGAVYLKDMLRPDARDTVSYLRKHGIGTTVLSGDNNQSVAMAAEEAGVEQFYGNLLPEEKLAQIEELATRTNCLAMVGDGINDAPALAAADLGIAMGNKGTDVALETADMALMSDSLSLIGFIHQHSRKTMKIIRQNIAFSLGTKILFILLAVLGLSSLWMAVLADTGLSLIVTTNSLRLLKVKKG